MHDITVRIADANTLHIVQVRERGEESMIVVSTHQARLLMSWISEAIEAVESEARGGAPPF